jgi:hypothetical protein
LAAKVKREACKRLLKRTEQETPSKDDLDTLWDVLQLHNDDMDDKARI